MTVRNKNVKMHRATATEYVKKAIARIREYNKDPTNPLFVKKAVVFGSYINTDKEMLSDVDIALAWGIRKKGFYTWLDWEKEHIDEICKFWRIKSYPMVDQTLIYMQRKALIQFRHRNMWVQFTSVDDSEERKIVYSDKTLEYHFEVDDL